MAAKTPATVLNLGPMGDCRLICASFADIDDGDTWASAITGIVKVWAHDTDNPTTQASVGCAASHSGSDITFYPAEDNKTVDLYLLVRS
jgi:hypothetical protein